MKNKILFVLTLIIVFTVSSLAYVSAANNARIVDNADLLTDSQETELLSYIDKVSEDKNFDLVFVTVDSLGDKTAFEYADDFFDYNGYGFGSEYDGALFLVSMEDGDWAISTCGEGNRIFDDAVLDSIEYNCVDYLSTGDYYDACFEFISISEEAIHDFNTFPLFSRLGISLIIGFVIAFITVSIMKGQLKSVRRQNAASVYTKAGSMNVTLSNDVFLYSHVSKRAKPKNNSSGGSRTSSSGRSHGGRSGKF